MIKFICKAATVQREERSSRSRRTAYRNQNRTESSELGENVVDLVVGVGPEKEVSHSASPNRNKDAHLDRDLSEVVGVRARENLLVMRQVLSRSRDVILNIGEVETLQEEQSVSEATWKGNRERTMSDLGATDQFSLQRFESPLTTSALLPMRRRSPMTFLRQVPILREPTQVSSGS